MPANATSNIYICKNKLLLKMPISRADKFGLKRSADVMKVSGRTGG